MSARNPWNCKHQLAVWPGALSQSLISLLDQEELLPDSTDQKAHFLGPLLQLLLGPTIRSGSAFWSKPGQTLEEAEAALFELYTHKAQIQDHQAIVEVGCGWGGWSLHIARRFPNCRVLALCSSPAAARFIQAQCSVLGLKNLVVQTGDLIELSRQLPAESFDRVLSIETPGLGIDWSLLTAIWAAALVPKGKLFAHCFMKHQLSIVSQSTQDSPVDKVRNRPLLSKSEQEPSKIELLTGESHSALEQAVPTPWAINPSAHSDLPQVPNPANQESRFDVLSQHCVDSLTQQLEKLYGVGDSLTSPHRVSADLALEQSWTLAQEAR